MYVLVGGENISATELEIILHTHQQIEDVAVVAMENEKWGEVPCAFVKLRNTASAKNVKEEDFIHWCRDKMAKFKVPKKVVFLDELPKTNTGKTQKYILRNMLPKKAPLP